MKIISKIAKWRDIWLRFSGRGIYPHELSFLLNTPLRKLILSPTKFADSLNLNKNDFVLEIGSGPGYLSPEVAKRVESGSLFLLDIQIEMLRKAKNRLKTFSNVLFVQGNANILPFQYEKFDTVYLVTVLGEVKNIEKCLQSIHYILRTGGKLFITEMKGDPDLIPLNQLKQIVQNCGFDLSTEQKSKMGFTISFIKLDHLPKQVNNE
jgi:ubiquinone/menaquinone biosynthesis C-methylase UbiE